MKRSIQIQIALVVVSIFVLIGVLFYNPADVEKPTVLVVDFGDGGKRIVGKKVAPAETDSNSIPPPEETGPDSPEPDADAQPDPKLKANTTTTNPDGGEGAAPVPNAPNAAAPKAAPTATPSRRAALMPKGTPPPPTPSPVPTKTLIRLPLGGTIDPNVKIETTTK
ncbi:hypothetical protein IT571_01395 [Candidatus Sumerlaeota bacterium]|nr:hypothetical protein [Candidatus Sumerlaeota bacterium]